MQKNEITSVIFISDYWLHPETVAASTCAQSSVMVSCCVSRTVWTQIILICTNKQIHINQKRQLKPHWRDISVSPTIISGPTPYAIKMDSSQIRCQNLQLVRRLQQKSKCQKVQLYLMIWICNYLKKIYVIWQIKKYDWLSSQYSPLHPALLYSDHLLHHSTLF